MNKWLELMLYEAREAYLTTLFRVIYRECPFCVASREIVKLGGEAYCFEQPCSHCYFYCSSLPDRIRADFHPQYIDCIEIGKEILRRLEEALW